MNTWISFWIGFLVCGAFIVDSVVLWNHRPKLALIMVPISLGMATLIINLQITRSWLGLFAWLLVTATVIIGVISIDYSIFKWQNR